MDRLFLDTNILQDILSGREGYQASFFLVQDIRQGKVTAAISVLTLINLSYINRRQAGIKQLILELLNGLTVIPISETLLKKALIQNACPDLEDEVQLLSAKKFRASHFITRNLKDFSTSSFKVCTPEQYDSESK